MPTTKPTHETAPTDAPAADASSLGNALAGVRVAVLVPCYNEAATIVKVVADFRAALPDAVVYVYDNNSTDDTVAIAKTAGATVRHETRQGKGAVVVAMFRDIDADVYIMVDGDDTYPAEALPELMPPVLEGRADMVIGTRLEQATDATLKPLHQFGNWALVRLFNALFGARVKDMLSGYRVMSRRFVKTIPLASIGFEIETEITVQVGRLGFRVLEIPIAYRERPEGSESKLRTFRDGFRILGLMLRHVRQRRPLLAYGVPGTLLLAAGITLMVLAAAGTVTAAGALPWSITGAALAVLGGIAWATAIVVDALNKRQRELELVMEKLGAPNGWANDTASNSTSSSD